MQYKVYARIAHSKWGNILHVLFIFFNLIPDIVALTISYA